MEVAYEDIVLALREASPRRAFARKATVVGKQGEAAGGKGRRLRAWVREQRLARLTDKAMAEASPKERCAPLRSGLFPG